MNLLKKILTLIFVIFLGKIAISQNSAFEHYSVEQGLPSSEVYAQIQDRDGYMWFATSKGVSRFDGIKFKNYTVRDGLPANSIIEIFEDRNGRIWFSAYNGELSYLKGDKIEKFAYNDTVRELSKNYFIDNLFVDEQNSLWITPSQGGAYKITEQGEITDISKNKTDRYTSVFKKINNSYLWYDLKRANYADSLHVEYKNEAYYFSSPKSASLRRYFEVISEDEFLFSKQGELLHVKDRKIVSRLKFKNDISGLMVDNKGNFWISVMYEGIYFYKNGDLQANSIVYLRGKSPISAFQDREGNYWFATTEDGVYFVSSFQFNSYKQYGFSDFNILSLEIQDEKMFFSTYNKQVFKCTVEDEKILSLQNIPLKKNRNYAILDIFASEDKSVWFLGQELFKMKEKNVEIIDTVRRGYKLAKSVSADVIYTSHEGFKKIADDSVTYQLKNGKIPISNSIYEDSDGSVWIGTINGLFSYNNTLEFCGYDNYIFKSRINDINRAGRYLLVATGGEGLVLWDNTADKTFRIDDKNGLNSNFVNIIFVQNDSLVWLGTNKGLCKLLIINDKEFEYTTEKYTKSDGLYTEEIKDIARSGDCIFLGTSKGLVSFFPETLKKNIVPPKIIMDSIVVNDFTLKDLESNNFKNNQNNVTIFFKAISFKATNKVKYKYKLSGFDENWIETSNNYVRFPNLPHGNYTFYLTASAEDGFWSGEQYVFQFKIQKHFTQKLWFKVLLFFIFVLAVIIVFWLIYRRMEKDLQNKHKLLFAEQKALRSQMNPHFIFNSLNSIRRYLLENDTDTADTYLTSFATLMRMVLENSKHNFIMLETEIETLKRYLNLEKMRFDDTFEFTFNVDKNVDIYNTKIPPMLLQPYLENAIWHGLAPVKREGKLELRMKNSANGSLVCIITDNGIGRKKSAEISSRRKNHKSTGMKNIEERINLINTLTNSVATVEVIDLYDDSNQPEGTKVIIIFPVKKYF